MTKYLYGITAAKTRAIRGKSKLFMWTCPTHGICDHVTKTGLCALCSTGNGMQWGNSPAILATLAHVGSKLNIYRKGY